MSMPLGVATWQTLSPHVDHLLEMQPSEREPWLAQLATTEPGLATELRDFLAEHEALEAAGFLEQSPVVSAVLAAPHSLREGKQIGAYQVERLLGRGGMGEVWLASRADGRFEGHCAIKLLDRSITHSSIAERFRREGRLLARLAHPHIARLLDAGTMEDGHPYLVLEYVEGARIDRYCEEHALDVDARVRLFLDVVSAVAHAHTNLIVHRDLKPSNVLVTPEGVVKLLDFGIAKLLTADAADDEVPTRIEDAALTPEYGAPEQLLGEVPSTATDVYQLGMLLYVLLTGGHPLQLSGTRSERIKAALEGRVPRASDFVGGPLRKRLRGDLDAILSMALRRTPQERYATAATFREDLVRYLKGEPVSARRGAAFYVAKKFLLRHTVSVSVAGIAALLLCVALVFAIQQSQAARAEARRAAEVNAFILSLFKTASPDASGTSNLRAVDLLEKSIGEIDDRLSGQPRSQLELYTTVGQALHDLGAYQESVQAFSKARALATQRTVGDFEALTRAELGMADSLMSIGELSQAKELLDASEVRMRGKEPSLLSARLTLSRAFLLLSQDSSEDAVKLAAAGTELIGRLLGKQDEEYFEALVFLTQAQYHADQCVQALPAIDDGLARLSSLPGNVRRGFDTPGMTTMLRGGRARCLGALNRLAEADAEFTRNDAAVKQLLGARSPDYAIDLGERGRIKRSLGDSDAAIRMSEQSAQILESVGIRGQSLAASQLSVVSSLLQARSVDRLEIAAQKYRAIAEDMRAEDPNDANVDRALVYLMLARGLGGDTGPAIAGLQEHLRTTSTDYLIYPARERSMLAWLRLLAGDYRGAVADFEASIPALRNRTNLESAWSAAAQGLSGIAYLELGEAARARQLLQQAVQAHTGLVSIATAERADLWIGLARVYLQLGEIDQARRYAQLADDFWAAHDPASRWAGEAAYWLGKTSLASGQNPLSTASLGRAVAILGKSRFIQDRSLRADARRLIEQSKLNSTR